MSRKLTGIIRQGVFELTDIRLGLSLCLTLCLTAQAFFQMTRLEPCQASDHFFLEKGDVVELVE